ncbi:F510_1955 family glycosylhydrolase [Microbacterium aurantiacum]|uniref:F510_1955 family glycosylhydrolase n=1 Tax=Microbacterium aurantiacum TaxID=162393 RepID=UPI00341A05F1
MTIRLTTVAAATALTAAALLLPACTPAPPPGPVGDPDPLGHVHAIAPDGTGVLLGTHTGIYRIDEEGEATGPVGGYEFDAMGFTVTGGTWLASGHPGSSTPPELGAPNLGLIRSIDAGETWEPVAFTGTEDFHLITTDPTGTLYGIGSTMPSLRISIDAGATWTDGATLTGVAGLAASAEAVYAATEEGLQTSTDGGVTFVAVADAPLLYTVAAADQTLAGVDTDGTVWRLAPAATWEQVGTATGRVQAIAATGEGLVLLVDDRGIVRLGPAPDETTILRPATASTGERP